MKLDPYSNENTKYLCKFIIFPHEVIQNLKLETKVTAEKIIKFVRFAGKAYPSHSSSNGDYTPILEDTEPYYINCVVFAEHIITPLLKLRDLLKETDAVHHEPLNLMMIQGKYTLGEYNNKITHQMTVHNFWFFTDEEADQIPDKAISTEYMAKKCDFKKIVEDHAQYIKNISK